MREMKDSGVAWIGEIPKEWNVVRNKGLLFEFNERCEADTELPLLSVSEYYGVAPKADKKADNEILTRAESLEGYKICEYNDIVMNIMLAWKRAQGVSKYNGIVSPAYCVYRKKKNAPIDLDYFHYLIRSDSYIGIYKRYSTGIIDSRLRLYPDKFLALHSHVPPLPEQQKIASLLDKKCTQIDTLISIQQQQIEKLKAYKQSLITEVVTKGLNPDVPMKDSGVEWVEIIPLHWEFLYPKALFTQRKEKAREDDKQLTASQQYGIMNQEEYMQLTGTRVVVVEKDFSILKHVEAGDFVISMRSFQGGLEYSEVSGCISSAYVMLQPSSERVFPKYYRWLLKSSIYINSLGSTSNLVRDGQAMRFSNFIQIWLPCPPMQEQKEIAEFLDKKIPQIDHLIAIKQQKIEKLQQYKKSVIYEYVTGKKEV